MLRLVIDVRRANRIFAIAPGVALATPEAVARLEVADGVTPYNGRGRCRQLFLSVAYRP